MSKVEVGETAHLRLVVINREKSKPRKQWSGQNGLSLRNETSSETRLGDTANTSGAAAATGQISCQEIKRTEISKREQKLSQKPSSDSRRGLTVHER